MQFNFTLFKRLSLTLFFGEFDNPSNHDFRGKLFQTQNILSLLLWQESISVLRFLGNEALFLFVEMKNYAIFFFEIFLHNQAFNSLVGDFGVRFSVVSDFFFHLIYYCLCLI